MKKIFLILILILFLGELFSQTYVINTSYQNFGDGYNSSTGKFSSTEVVNYALTEEVNSTYSRSFQLDAKSYSSDYEKLELSKYLQTFSASAKFGAVSGSINYSSSKISSIEIKSSSNYLVLELTAYTGTKRAVHPTIKEEYLELLIRKKTKKKFYNMFGDQFVKYLNYGSKLIILYEGESSSKKDYNETKKNLNIAAKYLKKASASFGLEEAYKSEVESTLKNTKVSIYAIGVDANNPIPEFRDFDSIILYARTFLKDNKDTKNVISVGTEPLNGLIDLKKLELPFEEIYLQRKIIDSINLAINLNTISLNNAINYFNNFEDSENKYNLKSVNEALIIGNSYDVNNKGIVISNSYLEKIADERNYIEKDINKSNNFSNDEEKRIIIGEILQSTINVDRYNALKKYIKNVQKANSILKDLEFKYSLDINKVPNYSIINYIMPEFKPILVDEKKLLNIQKRINIRVAAFGGWQTKQSYESGDFNEKSQVKYINSDENKIFKVKIIKTAYDHKYNHIVYADGLSKIKLIIKKIKTDDSEELYQGDKDIILKPKEKLEVSLNLVSLFGVKGSNQWFDGSFDDIFPHYKQNITEDFNFEIDVLCQINEININ